MPDPGARGRRRERWLVAAVALAAVLVLAGSVALAALPATSRRAAVATRPTVVHGGTHAVTRPTTSTGSSSPRPTTPTTPAPAAATLGAAPVISALNPASGVAGQAIGVSGANFLSANGQIVATFTGQVAPTSCPSPTTCSVTVPPMTQTSVALVTITTSSGTSNAVHFTYG